MKIIPRIQRSLIGHKTWLRWWLQGLRLLMVWDADHSRTKLFSSPIKPVTTPNFIPRKTESNQSAGVFNLKPNWTVPRDGFAQRVLRLLGVETLGGLGEKSDHKTAPRLRPFLEPFRSNIEEVRCCWTRVAAANREREVRWRRAPW
jgi:hypothetical protein